MNTDGSRIRIFFSVDLTIFDAFAILHSMGIYFTPISQELW